MNDSSGNKLSTSIILALTVFLLLGVVCIAIGYLIPNNESNLVGIIKGLLTAIGQTFIASSTISLFLSIKSIRDYFLTLLADVMTSNRFIEILSIPQLDLLHDSCHKVICQGIDFQDEKMRDVNGKYHAMFKTPFCEEMRENIDCHIEGKYIVKKFRTYYYLKNPNKGTKQTVDIEQKYFLNIPEGAIQTEFFIFNSYNIEIDGKTLFNTPKTLFEENSRSNYNNYNTFVRVVDEQKGNFVVDFIDTLKVEISFTSKIEKNDVSYTKRLRFPTKSFILNFTCADKNIRMVPQFFGGFVKREDITTTNNGNNLTIEYNKLALPGSGAMVVLNKIENIKKPKNTKPKRL